MLMQIREERTRIIDRNGVRLIELPADFLLQDSELIIRQERDGTITIQPDGTKMTSAHLARWNEAAFPGWFETED